MYFSKLLDKMTENVIFTAVQTNFKIILSFLLTLALICIFILSIPVYIFRVFVIFLAKFSRPDLGEILGGQSAILSKDYFSKKPPRSNIVVTSVLQGHLTCEELRSLVLKNWILAHDKSTGELAFRKFQQYPVKWLGFKFWKDVIVKFSIENHVHKASNKEEIVDDGKLNDIVEKLLNSKYPSEQSPWEFYVVENYKPSAECTDLHHKSVVIFRIHHCLGDGFSILTVFLEGLLGYSMSDMQIPVAQFPKRSFSERLLNSLTVPLYGITEMSYLQSYNFKTVPWKIHDKDKEWYQVCTKSDPIPIKYIKDIKNSFGVSFASVLLSAIASAIQKCLEESRKAEENKCDKYSNEESMLFASILPAAGSTQNRKLTNNLTAAVFEIPVGEFSSSSSRLKAIDKVVQNATKSVVPLVLDIGSKVMGANFYKMTDVMAKNRMISAGLTNFPGVPISIELNGKPVVGIDFVTGTTDGDAGVGIMTLSYDQKVRVAISAEKRLMSRKKAKQFMKYVTEEIQHLHSLK